MWPFKNKKTYRTYRVKYKDNYGDLNITIVDATTITQACREIEKRYAYPWFVQQILEIEEIR